MFWTRTQPKPELNKSKHKEIRIRNVCLCQMKRAKKFIFLMFHLKIIGKWNEVLAENHIRFFSSSFSNLPIVLHKIPEPRSIRRGKVNDGQEIIPFFKLKFLELSLSIECGGEKMFLVLGGAPLWLYCSLFWVKSKLQYYAVIAKMYRISTLTWSREWLVTKN